MVTFGNGIGMENRVGLFLFFVGFEVRMNVKKRGQVIMMREFLFSVVLIQCFGVTIQE